MVRVFRGSIRSGASYTNAFSYDKAGNRWEQIRYRSTGTSTITNEYNANDQLLKEVTLVSGTPTVTNLYAYDANGSLTARTNISSSSYTTLYGYDLKNKLSCVTTVGSGVTNRFQYNDQGIRVRTIEGSTTTYYLADANNHTGYAQVLEEFSVSGGTPTLMRSYVLGDDVLGQCGTDKNDPAWLLYDGHGSTRQVGNAAGTAVTCRYNYEAYGEKLTRTSTSAQNTDLLYCGEQYDTTLGMYNLRARFYDPSNGRFNAMDSFKGRVVDPESLHKYAYCANDPANNSDPSGFVSVAGSLTELLVVTGILLILAAIGVKTIAKPGVRPRIGVGDAIPIPIEETVTKPPPAPMPEENPKAPPFIPDWPTLPDDDDDSDDFDVHRIGGRANVILSESDKKLTPPGFSVLIGGTPQSAALQMRSAFTNATILQELSKVVGTAGVGRIRAVGFDVLPWPTKNFANHGRLIHQTRTKEAFENPVTLKVLSGIFVDTVVP